MRKYVSYLIMFTGVGIGTVLAAGDESY